ncbi:MAG: hypothetical protein LDL09_03365 [Calditerrivibrio sp.]|nr:hypothetical protein [Calditerrivibrio sp.]
MTLKKQNNKIIIAGSTFFQEEKLKEVLNGIEESNIRYFFGDEFDKEVFFDYVYSCSLFGETNTAVLRNSEKLKDKDVIESIYNLKENNIILLFNTEKAKEDDYRKYKEYFKIYVETKKLVNPQLIQDHFREAGFNIRIDTARYVMEICNKDMNILKNEIDKIRIYFNYEKPKTDENIVSLISFSKSENIYDFIKAFFNRDFNRTVSLIASIIDEGENIERVYYELSRHLISMFLYSISPGLVNEYTYTIHNYKESLSKWDKYEIANLISILTDIDLDIKTGRGTFEDSLYRLVGFSGKIN